MPRFKLTNREQGLMIPISFENQILPGTFEHAIDYIVDNHVEISALEMKYKNDFTGAPAYAPKVLLKIVLLAYSRGIISSRRIERACQENVIFMALTGSQAPDFTTIAWFVRSLGDDIKQLFRDVLLICSELDLLGGTEFALDGCKLSSNSAKEWSGTFTDLKNKKARLEDTVRFLLKKHRDTDKKDGRADEQEKERRKRQIERIEKKAQKIEKFLAEAEPKAASRGGEKQSNITDNESAKMKTAHGVIQGYNGMALCDAKRQVVVAAEAFGSGQEHELLRPMVEAAKQTAGDIGLGKKYFQGKRLIADTGAFCEDNLEYLAGENIDAYIPDQQFRNRDPRFAERGRHRPDRNKLYTKKDFTYRLRTNDFVCPEGKVLKYYTHQVFGNTSGRVYRALLSDCRCCTLRGKCLRSDKTRQRSLYVIEKFFHRNRSEEMMKKIDTTEGRDIYSRRMGIVEPVFGDIRSSKGLNRFTLRTKAKVNTQWVLYCMVHNIGKLLTRREFGCLCGQV